MAQLLTLPLAIALVLFGYPDQLPRDAIGWMFWISLPLAALLIAVACAMDRALRDLRHAWTLPLWPVFSLWASEVAVWGLILELRGTERSWNKFERSGVVSVEEAQVSSQPSLTDASPLRRAALAPVAPRRADPTA